MSTGTPGWLGPVAHVGVVADDLDGAMALWAAVGVRWSTVTHPTVRLQTAGGERQEFTVGYVTTSGGEPRLKIIGAVLGSVFEPRGTAYVHHLSFWSDDIQEATARLAPAGWRTEATGLEEDGTVRYRYLVGAGDLRIELGLGVNRLEFDSWADCDVRAAPQKQDGSLGAGR